MCPRWSNALVSLTKIKSNKRKSRWTKITQYTFDEIKRIVARDTLLNYPYYNEEFKTHTNAITFQLGAVIVQKEN